MKLNVYTIFDQAAAAYMRPFYAMADGQATRSFSDISTDANHEVGKHPEHYSLWRIGIFDDATGKLIPETKECLSTALEMVALSQKVEPGSLKKFDSEYDFTNDPALSPGGTD